MLTKLLSLSLCLCLLFEQTGFAQAAGTLDISGHLARLHSTFIPPDVFRPLHLRYLSYNPLDNNFQLFLDKGSLKNPQPQELEDTTKTLLNYFFVGLTLPNDTFWVNLRPDAEDNIIDDRLAQTDVGKIMLEADLQLKKDTAKFTSPETPEGREYWDRLYKKAEEIFGSSNITIPTLTRPWIVPDEIIISETTDLVYTERSQGPSRSAYIHKATLKVMLEQDYLKDSAVYNFKDDRLKELNEYSSQLIREIIIPKLTKAINSSKRYASLRQVYYSLIMAQWFKARFRSQMTENRKQRTEQANNYLNLIDSQNLTNLTSKTPWSKTAYFKQYQKSFKDGEYNIQEPVYTAYGQTIRSYFSGGMQIMPKRFPSMGQEIFDNETGAHIIRSLRDSSFLFNPKDIQIKLETTDTGEVRIVKGTYIEEQEKTIASSPIKIDETNSNEEVWSQFVGMIDHISQEMVWGNIDSGDVRRKLIRYNADIETMALRDTSFIGIHPSSDRVLAIKIRWQINGKQLDFGIGFLVFIDKEYNPVAFAADVMLFDQYNEFLRENGAKGVFAILPLEDSNTKELLEMLKDRIKSKVVESRRRKGYPDIEIKKPLNPSEFPMKENSYKLFTSHLRDVDRNKLQLLFENNILFQHIIKYLVLHAKGDVAFGNILFLEELGDSNKHVGGTQKRKTHAYGKNFYVILDARDAFNWYSGGDYKINDQLFIHELIHIFFALWMRDVNTQGLLPNPDNPKELKEYKTNMNLLLAYNYLKNRGRLLEIGRLSATDEDVENPSVHLINETLAYLFDSVYFWLSNPDATQPSRYTRLSREDITYEGIEFLNKIGLLSNEVLQVAKNIFSAKSLASSPLEELAASSAIEKEPVIEPNKASSAIGGIDFRSLPIVTQAVTNLSANLRGSPLRPESLLQVNLAEEWSQIERLANSGITPSSERIKEYIQSSCAQDNITQDRDKILLCISDILRLQEERC